MEEDNVDVVDVDVDDVDVDGDADDVDDDDAVDGVETVVFDILDKIISFVLGQGFSCAVGGLSCFQHTHTHTVINSNSYY